MIDTKLTFTAQIVFMGQVPEEQGMSVDYILFGLKYGYFDIEYVHPNDTIGNSFVIMVKPKEKKTEEIDTSADSPF